MIRLEVQAGPRQRGMRADEALGILLPEAAPGDLRRAFARRDVKQNGQRIPADTAVSAGDVLTVFVARVMPLNIAHEDARHVIVNKRQGMPVQGDGSVEAVYLRARGEAIQACHRLDVQTGGLVLLARDDAAREEAEAAFAAHTVRKVYQAVVCGRPDRPEATLHAYLRKDARAALVEVTDTPRDGARPIETRYRVLETENGLSLLEIELITGRTHQIRAHMAHIGHPVLGDDKYGDRGMNRRFGYRRQLLWATRLTLWDGRAFEVRADFPDWRGGAT